MLRKLVVLWAVINYSGIGGLFVGEIEAILSRVIHGGRAVAERGIGGLPVGPWIARCVRHDSVLFYILAWILETGRRACGGGIRRTRVRMGIDQLCVEVSRGGRDPGTDVDIEPEQGVGRDSAVEPVGVGESGNGSVNKKGGIVGQKGQRIGLGIVQLLWVGWPGEQGVVEVSRVEDWEKGHGGQRHGTGNIVG
jgi:hypothetical protein